MCSRGKHFSWVNLDQYYRCYGTKTDVSTKIPVKFMSSRHICHIFGSYCAFQEGIEFPSRPYACPPCMCVTGQTRHATLGNSVLKSHKIKKIPVFFTASVKVDIKMNIRLFVLNKKWERIINTAPLRPIRRQSMYRARSSISYAECNRILTKKLLKKTT
jgi:hypothetical protein